jgi:hypothetical protein
MQLVDQSGGTFTKQELERLAIYRAAVAAGFYTDMDGSADGNDTELLAWLRRGEAELGGDAYPFTPEERERLERLKAAVCGADGDKGGRYGDDRPPAAENATPDEADR